MRHLNKTPMPFRRNFADWNRLKIKPSSYPPSHIFSGPVKASNSVLPRRRPSADFVVDDKSLSCPIHRASLPRRFCRQHPDLKSFFLEVKTSYLIDSSGYTIHIRKNLLYSMGQIWNFVEITGERFFSAEFRFFCLAARANITPSFQKEGYSSRAKGPRATIIMDFIRRAGFLRGFLRLPVVSTRARVSNTISPFLVGYQGFIRGRDLWLRYYV
jgi:hypothetical protein